MHVRAELDLQPLNTLAVPSKGQYFAAIDDTCDLQEAIRWARESHCPLNILGGGSNVILPERVHGLTVQIQVAGKALVSETEREVQLRVGAGENWHELVMWCLGRGFYGFENLAMIPGTVGAAPVQNIGAYGVEVAEFIERVEGIELSCGEPFVLANSACGFGYRDSVFKRDPQTKRVITHVVFRLPRTFRANLSYPALAAELGRQEVSAQNVFSAVCAIRTAKLPDPAKLPNCGSFFKNPVVSETLYAKLLSQYPQMPSFAIAAPSRERYRKLAAAWLIDQAGWKGQTRFGVSVHTAQALVLVNPNRCSGDAVLALADEIKSSVAKQFAVTLELEPQVFGA